MKGCVCVKVSKAAVFIDKSCAECLHWNGGATLLFNAGASDIKEFSSFEVIISDSAVLILMMYGKE